jgi:signal peptidase II
MIAALRFQPGAVRRVLVGLAVALAVIALDQASKKWVLSEWPEARYGRVPVVRFLDFAVNWNRGVSFSMGNNLGDYDRIIFAALALTVCAGLVVWMAKGARPMVLGALGLIVGGALGNSIDRIRYGAVEDFLYVHIGAFDWWPIFNLADSMICIGAGLMIFDSLFDRSLSHKNTP